MIHAFILIKSLIVEGNSQGEVVVKAEAAGLHSREYLFLIQIFKQCQCSGVWQVKTWILDFNCQFSDVERGGKLAVIIVVSAALWRLTT